MVKGMPLYMQIDGEGLTYRVVKKRVTPSDVTLIGLALKRPRASLKRMDQPDIWVEKNRLQPGTFKNYMGSAPFAGIA